MNNRLIINILRFIGLLLLQVLVIDNIRLGYYVHPYIYVLFIFLLPFNIPQWQLLVLGFFSGFSVDLFNGTPGLNAAATVMMAFVRPFVINAMTRRKDINPNDEPSLNNMGISWFIVYSILLLLIHIRCFYDKIVGIGCLCCTNDLLQSSVLLCKSNVLQNSSGE